MTDEIAAKLGHDRTHELRTLLVADIVESCRLYESGEAETISRWLGILGRVDSEILPATGGRVVKSLGDGVLLEFDHALSAVSAAFALHHACHRDNTGHPLERQIMLRVGIEVADVLVAHHDVFGHGVNLAARLCTLAGPGETVVSAGVRDRLTRDLDADIEDLGDCYLKHIEHPVRAYRVGPPVNRRPAVSFPAMHDFDNTWQPRDRGDDLRAPP